MKVEYSAIYLEESGEYCHLWESGGKYVAVKLPTPDPGEKYHQRARYALARAFR